MDNNHGFLGVMKGHYYKLNYDLRRFCPQITVVTDSWNRLQVRVRQIRQGVSLGQDVGLQAVVQVVPEDHRRPRDCLRPRHDASAVQVSILDQGDQMSYVALKMAEPNFWLKFIIYFF
jgi:hypothetical protein